MQVVAIQLTPSDTRYFRVEPGYRIGHYLERDKPAPQNQRAILVIGRIPTGTQAPKGRLSSAQLQALADEGLKEVVPEVIARFAYWSYIVENGQAIEVPDGTECEPAQVLPPSGRDRDGAYVLPPDALTPLAGEKPARAEPAAQPTDKAAKAEKGD